MDGPIDVNLGPDGDEPLDELVIHKEDLRTASVEQTQQQYVPPPVFVPIRQSSTSTILRGLIGRNMLAGILSAIFIAVILQVFIPGSALAGLSGSFGESMLVTALYIAAAAGAIGAALGAVEPISQGNMATAASRAVTGLIFGMIGGFLGGAAAQYSATFFVEPNSTIQDEQTSIMLAQLVASMIGWCLAGIAIGVGRSFGLRRERVKNGLISGIIGGLFGGAVVGLSAISVAPDLARLLGILGFGVAMGAAAAGVDESRRDNWLLAVDGPIQGADFTVYPGPLYIGSSHQCEVHLRGPSLEPLHCRLEVDYGQAEIFNLSHEASVLVNGRPCHNCTLSPGDVLQVGNHLLKFCEKED